MSYSNNFEVKAIGHRAFELGAEEPYEGILHVRVCGERREQSRLLPGIIKLFLILLFVFSKQNLNAKSQDYRYLMKTFERDKSIVLSEGVTVSSYNFEVDRQIIEAIIFSPNERIFKFPAIILISDFEKKPNDLILVGIEFAKEGFACLVISQPGSGELEGNPDYAGHKTITALTVGYNKLRKESFVDPDKIGIYGDGGGALAALILATKLKDLKAAAFVSGIFDLKKAQNDTLLNTKLSQEELKARTPFVNIDKLNCPVLIVYDKKDRFALVDQSYRLRDKLMKNNKEFEIIKSLGVNKFSKTKILLQIAGFFKDKYALDKSNIIIKTNNRTKAELIAKTKLGSMISNLNLTKYIFSDKVLIQEGLRSQSHPFIKIATQHNHNDYLLLATFLHEQIHWYSKSKINGMRYGQELRRKFPNAPVGLENGGGHNEFSTYLHLTVNYFEYKAMINLFGITKAKSTLKSRDIYGWIYQTIFDNEPYFDKLFSRESLIKS